MEILPNQSPSGPDEYRFVRISVNPIGRTRCKVTFLGSEDGTKWEPFAHHELPVSAKRRARNDKRLERRSDEGPR
ncbi:MAG: hypothetical protein K8T20_04405 [Planctomycetes bacterium]|nr:hypothetical protein [Planctomycetota bacterium]